MASDRTETAGSGRMGGNPMMGAVQRHEDQPQTTEVTRIFADQADFVWRSLRSLGVPMADVDDAVQEVFLVVYRRIADYEDRGFTRAWLFSIGRQVASHYHRGKKRADNRLRGLVVSVTAPDIEELVSRREAERLVNGFLEELQEPQRSVFYLSDVEGFTAPEISAALDVKLNTVYGRLRKARKLFEDLVARAQKGVTES